MRRQYKGVNLKKVNNKKDLSDNLENVFKKFNERVCNSYNLKLGEKLTYWLNYWCHNYIPIESTFDYQNELLNYKKGDLISVNLGFNIGSEQGGLHYGIVLDNDNTKSNPNITIIPLSTHEKTSKNQEELLKYEVLIDNSIFKDEIERLNNLIKSLSDKVTETNSDKEQGKINKQITIIKKELKKISSGEEIYAQPSQIKTVSKLRIYYPTEVNDILYNINVGDHIMKEIEDKFKDLFFGKSIDN